MTQRTLLKFGADDRTVSGFTSPKRLGSAQRGHRGGSLAGTLQDLVYRARQSVTTSIAETFQSSSGSWPLQNGLSMKRPSIAAPPPWTIHVAIVIHNYCWRLGVAEGEARYAELEKRLAAAPGISVPTITLEGDANGAPHPEPDAYTKKFTGKYAHRTIGGGVGHNLPQEAPHAFAQAIRDVELL